MGSVGRQGYPGKFATCNGDLGGWRDTNREFVMSVEVLAVPPPGWPEWVDQDDFEAKDGRDPLGLETITTDRIVPLLVPGVLALSTRARYFSFHLFLFLLDEACFPVPAEPPIVRLLSWPQTETPARENARIAILDRAFSLVTGGGQGRGRTADLPLFRIRDGRLPGSMTGHLCCS